MSRSMTRPQSSADGSKPDPMEDKREKTRKHLAFLQKLANRSSGGGAYSSEPRDLATLDVSKVVIKSFKQKPEQGQSPEDVEDTIRFMYPCSDTDDRLQQLVLSSPAVVTINSELGAPGYKHKKVTDPFGHKYNLTASFNLAPHEQVQKAKPNWAELQQKAYENREKLQDMAIEYMMDNQDKFRSFVSHCCDKVDETHSVEYWMKKEFHSPFPTMLNLGDDDTVFEGEKGKELYELAKKNKEMKYSTKVFQKNYDGEDEPEEVEKAITLNHKDEKALLVREAYKSNKKVHRVPIQIVRGPKDKNMGLFDRKLFSGETVRVVSHPLIWCTGNLAGCTEILHSISVLYRDNRSYQTTVLNNDDWVMPAEEEDEDDANPDDFETNVVRFILSKNNEKVCISDTLLKDAFPDKKEIDIANAIESLVVNGTLGCNDSLGFEVIKVPANVGNKRSNPDDASPLSPKKQKN